ncbi:fadD28, partial [Cucurbita argyrosperma subsp. argyrosperma]
MDTGKPLEDQFSKLHPSLPLNTRIGIIGGGPSGLSAAYALAKLGYSDVTVLEKHQDVGGMCESVEIEGKIYDLGGQVLAANSAPTIFHLAQETGSELEEMDSHKLALIHTSGEYQDIGVADDYTSIISLTLELQDKAKDSGHIGVHAVSAFASDLTPAYLEAHGLTSVPKSVAYGYTASGYGFLQDMPYAYVHEFTRTSMAGKIRRFKGGYGGLWKRISESIPIKVHCNTEVVSVRRSFKTVTLHVMDLDTNLTSWEFDKIIISGSFPFRNGRTYRSSTTKSSEEGAETMDMSHLEKELFSKVYTIDYYTTVLKIEGLHHLPLGFYYFGEHMDNPETIGYPVAMQRFYADTDIFLFWSYGNSADITGPKVAELAINTVKKMGAEVKKVILQRRFKYFPHVCSKDMEDGFYKRLELELQGSLNTYYVGGLMAFELTERNSSYAMTLVCKHFANNSSPMFSYAKPMFFLQSKRERDVKGLGELPGVEFPDLNSLDGYLRHWGSHHVTRDRVLYTWLNEEGSVLGQRTYRELHLNASCIAQKLLSNQKPPIKPGDRVLLIYVPGLDFIDAFFGCLRAKILPVPVLPPDPLQRGGQALLKIEYIAKSCGAVAILSTLSYHSAVRVGKVKNMIGLMRENGKSSAVWPKLPWMHTDSWIKNFANLAPDAMTNQSEPHSDDVSFLQFTSGSTGDAKGVMITHGGLIHNVKLMRRRYKSTSRTVLVSWLPQYHDMGLIGGLFTALVSGGTAILFSPMTFIKKPLLWLHVMSTYKATHSAGPNFAFELVARRLEANKGKAQTYDLSSMVFLMIAAEPIRKTTLKKFLELTSPFGLTEEVMAPGYGLAENCVFVSCAFGEGIPIFIDWQGRVCCGYVDQGNADIDIRIVNPGTGTELEEDGKEGEIWISSPSAGIGYWGREELSQDTFRNELQNHHGRRYTRTGDLGRVIDGKLFITGRIKDLIIAAGRNIYPADVEKTVESSSDLLRPGCCAVIGVPEEILMEKGIPVPDCSDQVGLVVIAEVKDGKPVAKDIIDQIQNRVAEEHGVSVASVKLIKPRTISKTTSGKIKRFECLKQFVDGTLNVVPEAIKLRRNFLRSFSTGTCKEGNTPRPQLTNLSRAFVRPSVQPGPRISNKDIEEFLKGLVSELTNIPINKICATESLLSYGIDSILVVRAAQKLSNFLGVPVGAVDIFTATCIADLASISENILAKNHAQSTKNTANSTCETTCALIEMEKISWTRRFGIWFFQLLALILVAMMLAFPAYLSISAFISSMPILHTFTDHIPLMNYLLPLTLAPLAWILCIVSSCMCISFLGNSFLRPNYALTPEVSIWSMDFVKWWAFYKAQEVSSKVLAVHLRGTVFLKYWYEMFGARIGSSVILDTIGITDPSLVSIGDGVVIAEGALIQSHEVKNGVLSFLPIRIGQNSSVGPYASIHKGGILGEEVEVPALQKIEGIVTTSVIGNLEKRSKPQRTAGERQELVAIYHFLGIYLLGFLGSLSAAIVYYFYIWLSQSSPSLQHLAFICLVGAFHWMPFTVIAYATIFAEVPSNATSFAVLFSSMYLFHGIIFCILTFVMKSLLTNKSKMEQNPLKMWLCHRIITASHLRFANLLSGTEAFCIYLRLLGAVIGKHCSIRAINPVLDPELIYIRTGVHLGDFSRIISGFYSTGGLSRGKIEIQDNSVIGSQSIVLPGSVIQEDVILGALSVAPMNSTLIKGGVYVGSRTPVMIKNTMHMLDERIEKMDTKYKKIVGNLSANLAATTLKVKTRYFHRIGVSGKGHLKIYDNIKGLPDHKIFSAGKSYPVFIRHSNSLSADDDARIDARGAALRILSDGSDSTPLLDLTLKTGNAFYARTIADFATWLVCGLAAREEHVKKVPHIRNAVWNSLRLADSYSELHYYSNICRLFRFKDGQEMYVKLKLRPYDRTINEDSGKVEPIGILPPETGAIPRADDDKRPLLFLAEDFLSRVNSPGGVRYVFQLQMRPVPQDEADQDIALDCTKPWDETEFPLIDIGEIEIHQSLSKEESEALEFNPFLRCDEVDVISATSVSQSASIDHGRSLIYEICQHLRNGSPLPEAWKIFLQQSDTKVDLSGCPVAAALKKRGKEKAALDRSWYQNFWLTFCQPLLQTALPYYIIGLATFFPLACVVHLKEDKKLPLHWLLPLMWVSSGIMAALGCVVAKWVLVQRKKEGESIGIWSVRIFMDTIWQGIKTVVGDYFMEMTSGSFIFAVIMKLMGSDVDLEQGSYVDSMGALLNPEMVKIHRGGSVGREALLFGHIYEGGGEVKFGNIEIGEGGFVGSRAIAMPGVRVESEATLAPLSLAMKEEIIRAT